MEGYGEVQALAAYLVSLREENMALSNTQANEIIRLWNNLHDYDKQPTSFAQRHRTSLQKGKFKAPKRRSTTVVPGLDSTRRYLSYYFTTYRLKIFCSHFSSFIFKMFSRLQFRSSYMARLQQVHRSSYIKTVHSTPWA